jgi:hypothetical protein
MLLNHPTEIHLIFIIACRRQRIMRVSGCGAAGWTDRCVQSLNFPCLLSACLVSICSEDHACKWLWSCRVDGSVRAEFKFPLSS